MYVVRGHPVPFSLTVLPNEGENEPTPEQVRATAQEWLDKENAYMVQIHESARAQIDYIEGHYVWYKWCKPAV